MPGPNHPNRNNRGTRHFFRRALRGCPVPPSLRRRPLEVETLEGILAPNLLLGDVTDMGGGK